MRWGLCGRPADCRQSIPRRPADGGCGPPTRMRTPCRCRYAQVVASHRPELGGGRAWTRPPSWRVPSCEAPRCSSPSSPAPAPWVDLDPYGGPKPREDRTGGGIVWAGRARARRTRPVGDFSTHPPAGPVSTPLPACPAAANPGPRPLPHLSHHPPPRTQAFGVQPPLLVYTDSCPPPCALAPSVVGCSGYARTPGR
jgi:hypothetical protein